MPPEVLQCIWASIIFQKCIRTPQRGETCDGDLFIGSIMLKRWVVARWYVDCAGQGGALCSLPLWPCSPVSFFCSSFCGQDREAHSNPMCPSPGASLQAARSFCSVPAPCATEVKQACSEHQVAFRSPWDAGEVQGHTKDTTQREMCEVREEARVSWANRGRGCSYLEGHKIGSWASAVCSSR